MQYYYENPLIFGNYGDPSIILDGEDYFMVSGNSTHTYQEMLMWHSTNLLDWEPIYYVLNNDNTGSVWAPELVKYKDTYYIYNYIPDKGVFVITCKDIRKGDWGKPVFMPELRDIDPGHVVGEDGQRYIAMSRNLLYPISEDGLKVIGEPVRLCEKYSISDDRDVEGLCIESPKFFKYGDYYYYTIAVGGTVGPATSHGAVMYRSKSVKGPYEKSPYDPIIYTESISEKWWSKGHGTLFQGKDNNFYMIYHAIENAHRYAGRQVQLVPLTLDENGWFYVSVDDGGKIPCSYNKKKKDLTPYLQYHKGDKGLNLLFNYHVKSVMDDAKFTADGIEISCRSKTPSVSDMLIMVYQSHHFAVDVTFKTEEKSALSVGFRFNDYLNNGIYVMGRTMGLLRNSEFILKKYDKELDSNEITLRMINNHGTVSYFYKTKEEKEFTKNIAAFDIADWSGNISSGGSKIPAQPYGGSVAKSNIQIFGEGKVIIESIEYNNL